jgi:hypothetical protein
MRFFQHFSNNLVTIFLTERCLEASGKTIIHIDITFAKGKDK